MTPTTPQAASAPATAQAASEPAYAPNPAAGGCYVRDPVTGEIVPASDDGQPTRWIRNPESGLMVSTPAVHPQRFTRNPVTGVMEADVMVDRAAAVKKDNPPAGKTATKD